MCKVLGGQWGRVGVIEAVLVPASLPSPNLHWPAEPKGAANCTGLMMGFSAELGKRPYLTSDYRQLGVMMVLASLC